MPVWIHSNKARARAWAVVLAVVALCLVAFYAFLGLRYWQVSARLSDLASRAQAASGVPQDAPLTEEVLAQHSAAQGLQLAEVTALFSYPETAQLTAMLITSAEEAGAVLLSVTVGETSPLVQGGVQYQAMPMTVTLQGSPESVSHFLSLVQASAPTASVTGVRFSGLEADPLAQMQLTVHLSPRAIPPKKGPGIGTPTPTKK
ncbi:MAG: hypothetical protein HY680_10340 [Chloroflexi bacterium]|nr:hypothetical protein [Chloroflexota bacterium]